MIYRVKRFVNTDQNAPVWDLPPWQDVPAARLCHAMGTRPAHFPSTDVKMAYDRKAVSLLFRVEDRYVRAVATSHQQSVCRDSCVEFFFSPGPDSQSGYFNLEINCGGTLLFHFHPHSRRDEHIELPTALCNRIQCHPSLPRIVEPEITEPVTWTIGCRIPLAPLAEWLQTMPAPGETWRGNFYKCADATSHPHWLSWAPVEAPRPDFHLPRFFGTLLFMP
ncbi:MAG: carbohydrate-binding family 9-like protein [Desulfocapsaceae bacterium]|nr:carbohydrate-binding family 9-like protein [Desulfocapsaceae bacterium]